MTYREWRKAIATRLGVKRLPARSAWTTKEAWAAGIAVMTAAFGIMEEKGSYEPTW